MCLSVAKPSSSWIECKGIFSPFVDTGLVLRDEYVSSGRGRSQKMQYR